MAAPVTLRFDRGTIVLESSRWNPHLGRLPGVLWDPRVRAHRAPAAAHALLRESLAARGVPVRDEVRPTGGLKLQRWKVPELRDYQTAALVAWEDAGRRGVVVLPTGSGKTRVAVAAMGRQARPTLCLVPTRVLLEQWCQVLRCHYRGTVGVLGNGERILADVTVSTFASAERHMDRMGHRFDLMVVDEAHHVGAGAYEEILDMAVAPARLGLTATPPSEELALAALEHALGPIVFERSIADLAGRFLAPFDLVTVPVPLSSVERARYESERRTFLEVFRTFRAARPDAEWVDFVRAARKSDAGRRAVAAWRRSRCLLAYTEAKRRALAGLLERHRGARALVFTADNASAYAIAREHLIMPITCDIGRKERDAALARFRAGELSTLVSGRVLNEGFDVAEAEVAIVVGGSQGRREYLQRIGRILRPRHGKRALLYEMVTPDTTEARQARRRRDGLAAALEPRG